MNIWIVLTGGRRALKGFFNSKELATKLRAKLRKEHIRQYAYSDIDTVCVQMKGMKLDEFCAQWKCLDCGKTISHSYMDMVEVGKPFCSDCDREMELIGEGLSVLM